MKTCKRLLSAFIVISILCLSLGVAAATEVDSGSCGTNVYWSLDSDGVLTISGEGDITDSPWIDAWVESVIIEEGVTSIVDLAFRGCSNLKKVYAASIESWCNIQFAGSSSNPTYYGAQLYFNNILAQNITIPNTVTAINNYAFKNCRTLKSITIPEGVTSIGDWAFSNCISLKSITIPEGVTSIGDCAFYGCSSLKSIIIPEEVTSIGDGAFSDCISLTSIAIPEGVTSIGDVAFSNCRTLTSIIIPEEVTSIGYSTFYDCRTLTSITIPEGVTSIGNRAFYGCISLTSITIPERVTSIEYNTFYDCQSLTSITIPEGVTSIGDCAFYGCYSLTTVTLPSTIESIDEGAFDGCSKITDVYYYGTEAEWDNNVYVDGNNDNLKNAQFHYMKVVQLDGISLDKTELSLLVGEAGVITAAVSPYNSTYKSVSWVSSDESVATVSASGTVTAVGAGTATITATTAVGGFSASCTVTVTEPIKQGYKVNSITIKDGKGNELSKIPANSFLATVSITNIDADSETVLVLARYKKNGAFAKLLYVTVDEMPVGSTIKFTMPIDNSDGTVYRLKAFCWEDFTSAKPIGEAVTVY